MVLFLLFLAAVLFAVMAWRAFSEPVPPPDCVICNNRQWDACDVTGKPYCRNCGCPQEISL